MNIFLFYLLCLILVVERNCNDEIKVFLVELKASSTHVVPGTDTTLSCNVRTNSLPIFNWLSDGLNVKDIENWPGTIDPIETIHPENKDGHAMYKSVLRIKPTANHTYSCTAANENGDITMVIDIFVGKKAVITNLEKKPSFPQPKGHNVTIRCSVQSVPQPEIVWHYIDDFDSGSNGDGIEVEVDDHFDVVTDNNELLWFGTLHLFPASSDANYSCTARNPYGMDKKRIEVNTVDLEIGQTCRVDLDCSFSVTNSECLDGNCTCPSTNSVHLLEQRKCLPAVPFKGKCEHSDQCAALDENTFCNTHGRVTCQCKEQYIYSMDNLQCIEMKATHEYLTVLLVIGSTLVLIVALTLTLYFRRKRVEKKRLLRMKTAAARDNFGVDVSNDMARKIPNGSSIENGTNGKKVHFTT